MIIELAQSFSEFSSEQWRPYHLAIEHLLAAHGQGYHIFSPSRAVIASIASGCELSKTQRDILAHHIATRVSVLSGQARSADKVILCVPDNQRGAGPLRVNQIEVPLSAFSELEACNPAQLITENSSADGLLLTILCEIVGVGLGYSTPLKLSLVHGGGGTTGACYKSACGSARPTVCIVDSDYKYLGAPLGSTAKQVMGYCGTERWPTVECRVLPVRELENLLPVSTLLQVYANNNAVKRAVSAVCEYAERVRVEGIAPESSALPFFDFKAGMTRGDMASIPEPVRAGFKRFADVVNPAERQITEYDDPSDKTVVHAGFSTNLIAAVIAFLDGPNRRRKEFGQKLRRSPAWVWLEELLRLLLAYGAAGQRIPVR